MRKADRKCKGPSYPSRARGLLRLFAHGQAHQQYTLLDVAPFLLDGSFCDTVLSSVGDLSLHRFWFQYFDPLDARQQRERIDPILTKMLQFESKVGRRLLGQRCSIIHLSECIKAGHILIIRLAKSEAGLVAPIVSATLLSSATKTRTAKCAEKAWIYQR